MQAVGLEEGHDLAHAPALGHAAEEGAHVDRAVLARDVAEGGLELAPVGGRVVRRGRQPGEQHRQALPAHLGQDAVEIAAHRPDVEAAQHVVGAELDDDGVDLGAEDGSDPRQPAGAGLARDAGIDHARVRRPVRVEPCLELRREALMRGGRSPPSANCRRRGCAPRP